MKASEKIYNIIESQKDALSPSDFRVYNIARFPLIANALEKHSSNCEQCKQYLNTITELSENLTKILNGTFKEIKEFDRKKNEIENHLKKVHNYRFQGYYTSLFFTIGLIASAIIGIVINYLTLQSVFGKPFYIILTIGILSSYFLGKRRDNKAFKNKMTI